MKLLAIAASALMLGSGSAFAADEAAGAIVFKQCGICHSVGAGAKNKVGPVLNDTFGRTAGRGAAYNYSPAMQAAGAKGLVWGPETLAQYLPKPSALVPGTKMTFQGLANPDDVSNVIAYLATFSPNYKAAGATPAASAPAVATPSQ